MGGSAWVTLATNDSYSLGALVLAHSLKKVETSHQLAVLITPAVSPAMRDQLATVFDVVKVVDVLDSKDDANLALLKRPELGITFTKLHCWQLTQFEKGVFLDADTLVVRNCDELFDREEFSAAPDVGWPDCFNSGVFVFRPSVETFTNLVKFAVEKGSFDGGDQGLLNQYFSSWATDDIRKHLPFVYNLTSVAVYSYIPAFKQYGSETRIVHFIGAIKPWLQPVDPNTRTVTPSSESSHLQPLLQQWWDIFIEKVHPGLNASLDNASGMLPFFAQLGCSRDPLDSALAHPEPVADPAPSFPLPYTPYIEKDDERQYNLPYQPFQVVSSEGELLNITYSDFARENDQIEEESQGQNEEKHPEPEITHESQPEPEAEPDVQSETQREVIEEPTISHEEAHHQVHENPFDYHRFVPDHNMISAYLDHNVQEYQPYVQQQDEFWETPALPRFLTIPEDDPRQGHVPFYRDPSPERHQEHPPSNESWQHQESSEHRHTYQPQEFSHTSWSNEHAREPTPPRAASPHRAPSPVPVVRDEPPPEPHTITRSKSMSHLVIDATDTASFQNMSHWKSQPDVNPIESPKKLPGLKPLVPKVKSPAKSAYAPKYTESTEFHMVSDYSDPFAPPVERLGFVERAIMRRVESRKGLFDVPQGALEPAPPPTPRLPVRSPVVVPEMNEYIDLVECKRQAGNVTNDGEKVKPPEEASMLLNPRTPHRREKRSTRRASEKWKPPETTVTSFNVDDILKKLSYMSVGYDMPPPPEPSTGANGDVPRDFSRFREFVAGRTEVVEKGLAAFDDIINREPESVSERLFRGSSFENLPEKSSNQGSLRFSKQPDSLSKPKKAERRKAKKKSKSSKVELTGDFGPVKEMEPLVPEKRPIEEPAMRSKLVYPFAALPGESLSEMDNLVPEIVVCVATPEITVPPPLPCSNSLNQTFVVEKSFQKIASNGVDSYLESSVRQQDSQTNGAPSMEASVPSKNVEEVESQLKINDEPSPCLSKIDSENFTSALNGANNSSTDEGSFLSALSSNSSEPVESLQKVEHLDEVVKKIATLQLTSTPRAKRAVGESTSKETNGKAIVIDEKNQDIEEPKVKYVLKEDSPTVEQDKQLIVPEPGKLEISQVKVIEASDVDKVADISIELAVEAREESVLIKESEEMFETEHVTKNGCKNVILAEVSNKASPIEPESNDDKRSESKNNGINSVPIICAIPEIVNQEMVVSDEASHEVPSDELPKCNVVPIDLPETASQDLKENKSDVPKNVLPADGQNVDILEETLKFNLSKLVSDTEADELKFSNLETSTPSEKATGFHFTVETVHPSPPAMSYAAAAKREVSSIPYPSSHSPTTVFYLPTEQQHKLINKTPRKTSGVRRKFKPAVKEQPKEMPPSVPSPTKHAKRKAEKPEVEYPANRFELLPTTSDHVELHRKKKAKKAAKRFATPSFSPSQSYPSTSETIVTAVQEEPQLYLPEPDDSPGIAGAIAQLSLEPGKEGQAAGSSEAQAEYLRRQSWETGKMDYMGRDSFANVWSKISETLTGQEISESGQQSDSRPVSLAMILDCDSIDTLPTDAATSPGETAEDDVIFDPPPVVELTTGLPGILEESEDIDDTVLAAKSCEIIVTNTPPTPISEVVDILSSEQSSVQPAALPEKEISTDLITVSNEDNSGFEKESPAVILEESGDIAKENLVLNQSQELNFADNEILTKIKSETEEGATLQASACAVPKDSTIEVTETNLLLEVRAEEDSAVTSGISSTEESKEDACLVLESTSPIVTNSQAVDKAEEKAPVEASTSSIKAPKTCVTFKIEPMSPSEAHSVENVIEPTTSSITFPVVDETTSETPITATSPETEESHLVQTAPTPSIGSESTSAFVSYKPPKEDLKSESVPASPTAEDNGKEKKGVFTKLLEFVGVVKKKEEPGKNSIFYDTPPEESASSVVEGVAGIQDILKATDLAAVAEEEKDKELKKRSPSPRIDIPSNIPRTAIIEATPPTSPGQKPPRRDPEALTVDITIPETPPVVEKKTSILDEPEKIDRSRVEVEIDEIIAKAKMIVEDQLEPDPIYSNVAKKTSKVVILEPATPPIALSEDFEEIRVTTDEERKRPKQASGSKLSGQILKAIPPPRRKPFSDAQTPPGPSIDINLEKSLEIVQSVPESSRMSSPSTSTLSSPIETPSPPSEMSPTPPPVPPRRHRSKTRVEPQPPPKRKGKK